MTSTKYAFSLGIFIQVLLDQITPDEGVFRNDVMALRGALIKRNLKEQRLRNKTYYKAVLIAGEAYRRAMTDMKGTNITINAVIGRIFMSHKELLTKVYGLSSVAVKSLLENGIKTNVMDSVRVTNCFIGHLNDCYGIETPKKRKKK